MFAACAACSATTAETYSVMVCGMRAMVLRDHGGPEVIKLEQLSVPEPGPGEVRVRIRAVALNHLDIWVRRGGPAFKLEYPHRLGSDIAGELDALGPGASGQVGTKVVVQPGLSCMKCAACLGGHDNLCRWYRILGENAQGGYAEYIVVPQANIAPYPERLTFPQAAASILTNLTAWQMLVHKGQVTPGDTVLVQGAGSGIGVAAVQIAKLFGARVIATASTDDKLARAKALGADEVVNYTTGDFVAECRRLTDKRGVDIVVEHVGKATWASSLRSLAPGGRIVTCGATTGPDVAVDLRFLYSRQLSLLGSYMGTKGELHAAARFFFAGRLQPVVDRTFPLADAAAAQRQLEEQRHFGKIVLEC